MNNHKDDIKNFKTTDEYKGLISDLSTALKGAGIVAPKGKEISVAEEAFGKMSAAFEKGIYANQVNILTGKLNGTDGKSSGDTSPANLKKNATLPAPGTQVTTTDPKTGKVTTTTARAGAPGTKDTSLPNEPGGKGGWYHWSNFTAGAVVDANSMAKATVPVKVGKLYKGLDGNYYASMGLEVPGLVFADSKGKKQIGQWSAYNGNGQIVAYKGGGSVTGAGTSKSDSIPAYLSNGEYVVRSSAVSQYGVPFFDAVNAQKFAGGGMAKNKSLMKPGDKWDNRSTTQSIGKFLLGNIGPQSAFLNVLPKDIKNKITKAMWSMFGKPLEEIAAGSPTKGDWANAALSMVPMGGELRSGIGGAKIAESAISHINPVKASTQIMRNLNGSMLESAIADGRKVPTVVPENWWANKTNPTPYLEQFKDMFRGTNEMHPLLMASDYGAGFRKYWGRAYDSLVKSKDPSLKGIKNVDDFFRSIADKTPGWGTRYSEDATHPLIEAANKAVMGAHGLAADQPIALFKSAMHQGQAGYSSISSKFARAYLKNPHLGIYRDAASGMLPKNAEAGLYKIITEAKKLKDPLGLGGIYDEFANVIPQSLNNAVKIGSGTSRNASSYYTRAVNLSDFYSALNLGKKTAGQTYGMISNSTSDLEKILSKMDPAVLASKMKLPKFDNGINNVPADMLAQLHKNEAVLPAKMNPFNPNANNATMGNSSYTVNNYINGYDGNINELSDIVTKKTITAIKILNGQSASMVGTSKNVSIKT
jgi:hypothetical protein